MKFVSWNVNGIRAAMKKDFKNDFLKFNADIFCLQETKAQCAQTKEALAWLSDYHLYTNSAERKGYSGTAIMTRTKPLSVTYGLGIHKHDQEGRVITLRFDQYFLVNVYTPNSGRELKRLDYRQTWDQDFLRFLQNLEKKKAVIVCGDLNVAHRDIDLANHKPNYNRSAGYMQEEIDGFDGYMAAHYIDSFRFLHPDTVKYSWWSYRAGARSRNVGWRIDYFLLSASLKNKIKAAQIHNEVLGSDHCPVSLVL